MRDLLHPLVVIRRRPAAAGHVWVGVLEFAGGELVDGARLRLAFPVGESTGHDVEGDGLLVLIDRVGAEHRKACGA